MLHGERPARIVLCTQDDALALRLTAMLGRWAAAHCVETAVQQSGSLPAQGPELLFIDADTIPGGGPRRPDALAGTGLVVVSRRSRQAISAYRWHAAAFLAPDTSRQELGRAMDQCFSAWRCGLQWLDLPARRERVRLPLCQVAYAEAAGRESILRLTNGGSVQVSVPIKKLEEDLPGPPFFRCQKAFIVHLSEVGSFAGGRLNMAVDGRSISVSRQQASLLRQALKEWREEETLCTSR